MKALVPLADGVEEMEAVIIIDVLRRAKWLVTTATLANIEITGAHDIKLTADAQWNQLHLDDFSIIILPGGAAASETFATSTLILDAIRSFVAAGKPVAAICAAPLALHAAGALSGKKATAYPSILEHLTQARQCTERVVIDGNIVTSRGPGTAFEFALALVRLHDSPTKANDLTSAMLVHIPADPQA